MQTINSDSGNRKFYVITSYIYFSSMETDINFLLVFSLLGSWSCTYYLGGGGILLGDHHKNLHWV